MNASQLIDQYKLLHSANPGYGNGATYGKRIAHLVEFLGCKTVLDFGCGKGKLINKIKQYCGAQVYGYDPAVEKYSDKGLLERDYDLVVANDVLEHLHQEEYHNQIEEILNLSDMFFFNISCRPAVHKLPCGDNCHTLIKSPGWWIDKMQAYGLYIILHEYNPENKNLILCLSK